MTSERSVRSTVFALDHREGNVVYELDDRTGAR